MNISLLLKACASRKTILLQWISTLLLIGLSTLQLHGVSVKDFGAVGNGSTDDTTAFRNAIERAGQNGVPLQIPAGRYLILNDITINYPIEFVGSGHQQSIITAPGRTTRFLVRQSNTSFRDLGFEQMIEPIGLVSRSDYTLENLLFERCRFENLRVNNRNRGVIGLTSGNSSQRPHRIRNLVVRDCIFQNIDAHAINIRGNISDALIVNNQFFNLINSRGEEDATQGGYAIRLGESSDDAGLLEVFAPQGHHRIEGNVIRNMQKRTVGGNLIGMLLYGNYSTITGNLFEDIDGTAIGDDVDAIYVRGAFNEFQNNIVRNVHGADDDGAVAFKGGLNLGSQGNIVSNNLIENIRGMSGIEASSSYLEISNNIIINSPQAGVKIRGGDGLLMTGNHFKNADSDIRTQWGEVVISENQYIDSRILLSQRQTYPSAREAVFIHNNLFQRTTGSETRRISFVNGVEEQFVSIRNNRFEFLNNTGDGNVVDLVSNGSLQRVEVIGNHIEQNGSAALNYRINSPQQTVSGNTNGNNGSFSDLDDPDNSDGGNGPGDGGSDPGDSPGGNPVEMAGLIAYYSFTGGSGNTAIDSSGFGSPLNLTLSGGAAWLSGKDAVVLDGDSAKLQSTGAATKLASQIAVTGQFSIEVWARPTILTQAGPARLVTYSDGTSNRNFTFSHGGDRLDPSSDVSFRLRTTGEGDNNGLPNIGAQGAIANSLSHYVATFDGTSLKMYRNGTLVHSEQRSGTLTNWDSTYPLVLGNEASGTRGWAGELHQVGIYDQALGGSEIQNLFNSGSVPVDPLPPILPTDFRLKRSGNPAMSLSWTGLVDHLYQLQFSNDLKTWSDHDEAIIGDGTVVNVTGLPGEGKESMLYRLLVKRSGL